MKQPSLFEELNSSNPSIKRIIKKIPKKFLDTEIFRRRSQIETKVYNKSKTIPAHWSSKITIKYKRNDTTVDDYIEHKNS